MKHQRIFTAFAVAAIAAGVGYGWHVSHASAQQNPQAAPAAANALVVSRQVQQQSLMRGLDAFGEVATAKPDALSFPQAGQLTVLAVAAGQHVRRGDLLARLASDPNAISAYAQAANAVAFGRRELQRQQQLLDLRLATQSQVDAARKQLEDAQAALTAQARLGGASASVELRAPYEAVVTALVAAEGERLAAGATVLQLGRSDHLRVLLGLEPSQSALVRPGMPVTIAPVASGAKPFDARIATAGALVDPKTQLVMAIVDLLGAGQPGIVAGTRVQATIRLGERKAWAVPRQAVLSDDRGAYLFQVSGGKAHRVDVAKVSENGQVYGVDGQLDARLPVVVQGNYELTEGMAVREGAR